MIKRMTITTALGLLLLLSGCSMLQQQADDPNSPLSNTIDVIDASARAVIDASPAAGPYGYIAGAIATVVAAATGAYKVRQKNQTIKTDGQIITAQQREFAAVRDTTKAIVSAIENLGSIPIARDIAASRDGTLAGVVKMRVGDELANRNLDIIGKAIIDGLKASQKPAA